MPRRSHELLRAVVVATRPLDDLDERDRVIDATLGAVALEGIGVDGLGEWSARLVDYAGELARAGRRVDAGAVLAAADVLLAE